MTRGAPGSAVRSQVRVAVLLALATLAVLVARTGVGLAATGVPITDPLGVRRDVAAGAPTTTGASRGGANRSQTPRGARPRAPSSPPLVSGAGLAGAVAEEEQAAAARPGEADPLVSNGLSSPLCKGVLGEGELSGTSRRDCETSGFVAALAPTGNYGIDVHINTGLLGLSRGGLLTIVQDLFVTPLWMALVWVVHTLVVMLEWCFAIDLLDSTSAGVGRGLRATQAAVTQPWLAAVLAVASVLTLYNGLIRRRVAETVGQALLMLVMMTGGMWVMLDPAGTVGALGGWANQASLGTLAVTSRGSPAGPGRALADSLGTVFSAVIEAPWCYLEFGDVGWCRDPGRLDPRLRSAGLKIAASELAMVGCNGNGGPVSSCAASGSARSKALEHSAQLLREARSNGAIFLALPANGPARNSINEQGSLLRVLCQSSNATSCSGPTAAQAQFRTDGGTWPRVGGLLLIVVGVLGMLLLLGFIALRLLAASIFALLYLLLAPAAVLAPALGEGGRTVFRRWALELFGMVVSKLVYSFLLGIVLAVLAILAELEALGWWTRWMLMSIFWWGAFLHRHRVLEIPRVALGGSGADRRLSIARRPKRLGASRTLLRTVDRARNKRSRPARDEGQRPVHRQRAHLDGARARQVADEQVGRSLEVELGEARALTATGADSQARLSSMRSRLERVQGARERALLAGDTRRGVKLGGRAMRLGAQIEREQHSLDAARRTVAEGERAQRRTGATHTRRQREERARFLETQMALPASGLPASDGQRRDYAGLAGLAGYGQTQFERLDPRSQREARLRIDRELTLRTGSGGAGADLLSAPGSPIGNAGSVPRRERREAGGELEGALTGRPREEGRRPPGHPQTGRSPSVGRSSVLDDAREVAARRKRQLGRDRS